MIAKKPKINPHIPGTVAAKKIDPGTNAPTETPNPEPAKSEHTCPPWPPRKKKINPHIPGTVAAKKTTLVQMHPLKLPTLSQPKANILDHTRILYTRYYMIYYIQYTTHYIHYSIYSIYHIL